VLFYLNQQISLNYPGRDAFRALFSWRKEGDFEIEQMLSFASLSEEDRRSDTMKDKETALIGMAIGAAVISLVATQKQINQGSIVDELVRLGRQKGDGVEDEVFVQAARLVRKGT
jgi:hypothetical protein